MSDHQLMLQQRHTLFSGAPRSKAAVSEHLAHMVPRRYRPGKVVILGSQL